jgi:L-fuconolactonase
LARRSILMTVIDSQVHAYEANTPNRPWHSVPNWPDHVTGDEMMAAMDKVGVDGAIFISAFSMYRYDASYAVEVQRAHPGRFAIVKPVDPDDPAVADIVADWKSTPGAVGIRIMLTKEANRDRDPNDPGLDRILRAAVRHDFPVSILCWGNLDAGTALIDRHPDARFIIDHLGIMQPRTPPAPPQPWADLPKVLELARRPNTVIKVSGACTLAREPYPFPDIWEPLARVFDAWGFDRCLWGTDWTRAFAVVNHVQAVEPFIKTDRLSDAERAMLMGADDEGTLAQLKSHHSTSVEPKIKEYRGHIVRTTGAGLLVLFASVGEASLRNRNSTRDDQAECGAAP